MKQMSNFIDFEQELIILKQNTNHTASIVLDVIYSKLVFSYTKGGITYSQSMSFADCKSGFSLSAAVKVKHCQEIMEGSFQSSVSRKSEISYTRSFPKV